MNIFRSRVHPFFQLLIVGSVCSVLVCACTKGADSTKDKTDTTRRVEVTQISKADEMSSHTPTPEFITLVAKMDSLGFSSDTSRVRKLIYRTYLSPKNISIVDGNVYYHIDDPTTTQLFRWNNGVQHTGDSLAKVILNDATSVWAYFYCDKKKSDVIEDGVIEQWEFSEEKTPRRILDSLISFYPLPYFNTAPFYLVSGNYLYVFYTRANAFSFRQQEFFRIFKKEILRSSPHHSYGLTD